VFYTTQNDTTTCSCITTQRDKTLGMWFVCMLSEPQGAVL